MKNKENELINEDIDMGKYKPCSEVDKGPMNFFKFIIILCFICLLFSFFKTVLFTDIKLFDRSFGDFFYDWTCTFGKLEYWSIILLIISVSLFLSNFYAYKSYMKYKKEIIQNAVILKGNVIDVKINSSGRSSWYNYFIKLETGEIIKSESYYQNFFKDLKKKECTVYKYKDKHICVNFE